MDFPLIPDIESDITLPSNAREAFPDLTPAQELEVRMNTVRLISDLTLQPIVPDSEDEKVAAAAVRQMVEDPETRPDFDIYPNETIALMAGIAARYNHMIVKDLAELKLYVVNRLFEASQSAKDDKTRITALTKLGEVDGVDAFKKRSEITHQIKPVQEIEKEFKEMLATHRAQKMLEKQRNSTSIDAEYTEIHQGTAS
jgi:hypothetical protein